MSDRHEFHKRILEQMTRKTIKPPIGLTPKWVIEKDRLDEIRGAISRYYTANLQIPIEWINEYNELIK